MDNKENNIIISRETSLSECGFSTRVINWLYFAKIKTIGDLLRVKNGEKTLAKIKNFGKVSLSEVLEFMKSNGLQFDCDTDTKKSNLHIDEIDMKSIELITSSQFEIQWIMELNKIVYFFLNAIAEAIMDAQGKQSSSSPIIISDITYSCDIELNSKDKKHVYDKIIEYLLKHGWKAEFTCFDSSESSNKIVVEQIAPARSYTVLIVAIESRKGGKNEYWQRDCSSRNMGKRSNNFI